MSRLSSSLFDGDSMKLEDLRIICYWKGSKNTPTRYWNGLAWMYAIDHAKIYTSENAVPDRLQIPGLLGVYAYKKDLQGFIQYTAPGDHQVWVTPVITAVQIYTKDTGG